MVKGRHKLSAKIFGILALFFLVAISAIGMTLHLSWQLEGAAAAINDAGSERMRSYRIGYLLSRGTGAATDPAERARSVLEEEEIFERVLYDLEHGNPRRPLYVPWSPTVQKDIEILRQDWFNRMRPLIAAILKVGEDPERARLLKQYDSEVVHFVGNINEFVLTMEQAYAYKTNLLRMFQVILVVLALIGTAILMRFFFTLVIGPVNTLQGGIQRMALADFSVRLPVETPDELGELAQGFNQMADHLQNLYSTLEQRVEEETSSLAGKNRELALLYGITAFLSEPATLDETCRGFLWRVKEALGASAGAIRLYEEKTNKLRLMVHAGLSEEFLRRETLLECGECLCSSTIDRISAPCIVDPQNPPRGMVLQSCRREGFRSASLFNISYKKRILGVFNLYFLESRHLMEHEIHLVDTLCQHLGVTVENQCLRSREKEMAINEERNLLAQELHDSIAQGLAFLNLQVQMLEASLHAQRMEEAMEVTQQIKEGVQESYEDVRELLVHFRTHIGQADLATAISNALKKLKEQTGVSTTFDRRGHAATLRPEDEIQVLHIVQEALSNIRKHAQARNVKVTQSDDEDGMHIAVSDDGIGFNLEQDEIQGNENHIGLKIIRERAHRIGGGCRISSVPGAGTKVELEIPRMRKENA